MSNKSGSLRGHSARNSLIRVIVKTACLVRVLRLILILPGYGRIYTRLPQVNVCLANKAKEPASVVPDVYNCFLSAHFRTTIRSLCKWSMKYKII
jgi:hypothetical protein